VGNKDAGISQLSRREFLLLLGMIGTGTAAVCAGTGLATALALLSGDNDNQPNTEMPVVVETPPPTEQLIQLPTPTPDFGYPNMIKRHEWGALSPDFNARNEYGFYDSEKNPEGWRRYDGDLTEVYNTVVIHHSGSQSSDDRRSLLDIQLTHRINRGWADIGYHYVVGKNGDIYEGRDLHVRGTHVEDYNTGSVGVCLLGDFDRESPTNAQIGTAIGLVQWLARLLKLTHLAGHRNFNPTTQCPGNTLVPYLQAIAINAGLEIGTGGYVPSAEQIDMTATACDC
jgi:hypothetical protein